MLLRSDAGSNTSSRAFVIAQFVQSYWAALRLCTQTGGDVNAVICKAVEACLAPTAVQTRKGRENGRAAWGSFYE
jgi:hypothetical protein